MAWSNYLVLLVFFIIMGSLYRYLSSREERLRKRWKLVAEGEYLEVIHKHTNLVSESGMKRRRMTIAPLRFSTILFKDETTARVMNVTKFPPEGTYIKIYKNPLPEFRIEIVKNPLF